MHIPSKLILLYQVLKTLGVLLTVLKQVSSLLFCGLRSAQVKISSELFPGIERPLAWPLVYSGGNMLYFSHVAKNWSVDLLVHRLPV
jgi:hypothetical protein